MMSLKIPDTIRPSNAQGAPIIGAAERCKVSVSSGTVGVSMTGGSLADFYSEIWVTVLLRPVSTFASGIVSAGNPSYFVWAGRVFRTGAIALPVMRRGRIDHYTVRAQAVGA